MCLCVAMIMQAHEVDSLDAQTDSMFMQLQELTVTAQKSLVKLDNGRISTDIHALTAGKGVSNAFEALEHVPGLTLIDEKLQLFGISDVKILINGKTFSVAHAQLVQILRSIPMERIEKIELMPSAPPETGVRGAAVNIVLKNVSANVTQGCILGNVTYAHEWSSGVDANLLCNHNSWQFESNIVADFMQRSRSGNEMEMWHEINGENLHLWQYYESMARKPMLGAYFSTTYNFENDKYVRMRYYYSNIWRKSDGYSLFKNVGSGESENISILTHQPERLNYIDFDLHIPNAIKMSLIYVNSKFSSKSEMENIETSAKNDVNTFTVRLSCNSNKIYNITIPYGINATYSKNDATDIVQKEITTGIFIGAEYTPNDKFNLTVHINGEYYRRSESTVDDKISRFDIYPQLTLSYMPNTQHIFQLNMMSGKAYPTFSEQSQSERYINRYIKVVGNPELTPSRQYSSIFSYVLKQRYVFALFATMGNGTIIQQPYQLPERAETIFESVNLDYSRQFGVNATLPFSIGNINVTPQLIGAYMCQKNSNFHEMRMIQDIFVANGSLKINYRLPMKPKVFVNLETIGVTSALQGVYNIQPMWKIGGNVMYLFANDKASFTLSVDDVFNSWNGNTSVHIENQHSRINECNYKPQISLKFSYTFGGFRKKSHNLKTDRYH